jgi:PAS domain S-box-containing protein
MFSASAFEGIAITEATRIVDANEQLARMLGLTSGEMVGREMLDFIAPDSRERAAAMLREGSLPVDEFFLLRKDGTVFPVEAQGRSFLYRGSPVRVTTIRDITVRREHEALLNGQRAVLEMIAKGMPLGETLDTLLRVIETQWPDMLCSILLLDPDGMHLRHAAAPNLPGEYLRAIDGASIGEGAGSCGTAAHRGEQVIVEDIAADPLWADYRGLALPHGLRACWSTPIFDPQHRVLGTFAMYYRTPRRPGAEHVRLVETVTHTAAIAILRHDREQALRLSEEKFSRAFRVSPDSITISRIEDGRFIEANEGFERMSGYSRAEAMGRTAIELGLWQNSGQRAKLLDGLRELGSVRDMDFDFTVKGGAVLACLVSAEKITVNGEECLLATTRDVTERKRAEETLRRTSTQMMELLARVTDGFVALDKEWRYVYVNPNAALMFGRDQASLLGKHIWTEFPEGVGEKFHLAYEEAMRDQQAKSIEAYYPPWKKWYENRIYPSPHGLSIYFRDITESKRAEALLRESELRYQNLLQSVEGIVWEADAATLRFTFASHQAERLLGYPVGQWLDEPSFWSEHLHPEDRAWAVESRKRQMQGEEPHAVEYRMISADGRVVWLRDIVSAIVDDHEPLYLRGLMIDITEQMLANEALRRSEAKFRAVAETATAAIFVYRGDEFAYVNAGAASITGYETGELAATKLSQIVHPDFHELVRGRGDLRVLGEETPSRYELKLVTKSGEERWVDFSTGLMEFDGKTAALGIAFDVTARKLAEEQLQHTTEQLRALSAHLQSVREEEQIRISREIHDQLGQAMTGLRMDVSWITKRLGADQPELVDRVEGMKSLIDETIQMVRRISSELRPGVLDNLGLIPAIDWQVKEFRTRTSIACELHLPDDSPVLSTESATAVFRIFQETLTNVARHSGADRVTVTITVHAGTLILEVADNGKGISPGDIGKSLGLVGMRERAMAVGGSVSVTGEPAKGTTVVLRVPLQRPAASPAK